MNGKNRQNECPVNFNCKAKITKKIVYAKISYLKVCAIILTASMTIYHGATASILSHDLILYPDSPRRNSDVWHNFDIGVLERPPDEWGQTILDRSLATYHAYI